MKNILHRLILAVSMATMGVSCSTVYDSYGRPRTVVEPGAALLGVAAAGLIGYTLASDHHHGGHYRGRHGGHYRGHYRGYDRCY